MERNQINDSISNKVLIPVPESGYWEYYRRVLPLVAKKRVVDLTCGKGYGAALISDKAATVLGVDRKEEDVLYAAKKYPSSVYTNLSFLHAAASGSLVIEDQSFDLALWFANDGIDAAHFQAAILPGIKRILDKNGVLILALPNEEKAQDERKELVTWLQQHFYAVTFTLTPEEVQSTNLSASFIFASDDELLVECLSAHGYDVEKQNTNTDNKLLHLRKELNELSVLSKQLSKEKKALEERMTQRDEVIKEKEKAETQLRDECTASQQLVNEKQRIIDEQSEQAKIYQKEIALLKEENSKLLAQKDQLKTEQKEKDRLLQDLQFNCSLTRQQLSEVNNKLVTIYDSDGWRALDKYYSLKGKYLNENSTHYRLIKQTYNFLRNKKEDIAVVSSSSAANGNNGVKAAVKREIPVRTLPYFENPTVSIVIPVYNAWEMNEKCIVAIIEHTADTAYEVIIADDCSTDETKDIAKYFLNIVHVRNEKNLGFLKNCNHAASHARGKYIHFLNNDTEVKQGWLSSLVRLMESDGSIGLSGSKLVYPNGKLQEAGGIIWNDASGWNFGNRQNPEMPEFNYVKEVDYISGASMLVRKSLWEELGGFDDRYTPAYCEDSDLAYSIRALGYKVVYQPLSEVVHYEGYSHGSDTESSAISSIKEYQKVNNQKFFEKWKEVLHKEQFPNAENVFWAKDRSRNKKTLLMVDHYVPQFDKDAGSRTTFQYLTLFVKLGYNVKFLGENFYKHEPYTTVLQQMGIEVLYGPWYRDNWQQWFKDNNDKFDYIYLNRPHISINFIDFFKQHSAAKIIYYGHDLHFLREQKKYEVEGDSAILEQAEKWKKIEMYLFESSDLILTPSTEEQVVIKSLDKQYNVQLMRPYIYQTVQTPETDFSKRKDLLFVGGFGHLPNVDGVLWFTKEVWPLIKTGIPDARFIVAGSNPPAEIKALASNDVIIKGYVSDDELESLYATCKIAVIPLRYGAGVKGKTVEAMRYGMPLVTTDFGVEGLPGNYTFLSVANNSSDFATEVLRLYISNDELCRLSELSTEYIKESFIEKVAKDVLNAALTSIH
jgi:GT2 family glycosyltransferase/ubiquinone/menaquinone biosynthesis C-methylase UbiE